MTLGERIRELRLQQDYSGKDFAKRCRLSPAGLSFFENGRREPSLTQLARIASALQMTVVQILLPVDLGEQRPALPFDPEQDMIDRFYERRFEEETDRNELRFYFNSGRIST